MTLRARPFFQSKNVFAISSRSSGGLMVTGQGQFFVKSRCNPPVNGTTHSASVFAFSSDSSRRILFMLFELDALMM